jgi:hypothetical protein
MVSGKRAEVSLFINRGFPRSFDRDRSGLLEKSRTETHGRSYPGSDSSALHDSFTAIDYQLLANLGRQGFATKWVAAG